MLNIFVANSNKIHLIRSFSYYEILINSIGRWEIDQGVLTWCRGWIVFTALSSFEWAVNVENGLCLDQHLMKPQVTPASALIRLENASEGEGKRETQDYTRYLTASSRLRCQSPRPPNWSAFGEASFSLHLLTREPPGEHCSSGTNQVPQWHWIPWLLGLTQPQGSSWGFVCKGMTPPCEYPSETAESQSGLGRRDL